MARSFSPRIRSAQITGAMTLGLLSALALTACQDTAPEPLNVTQRNASVPSHARSAGPRAPLEEPAFVLKNVCTGASTCSVADVNGDGKADLVRRTPGTGVEVALSDGWSFGAFAPTKNECPNPAVCVLGEFDEIRGADNVRLDPAFSKAWAAPLEFDGSTPTEMAVPFASCPPNAQRCTVAELDGDPQSELAWIEDNALFISGITKSVMQHAKACSDDEICGFFEFDGVPGAEWVRWNAKGGGMEIKDLSKGGEEFELAIECGVDRCQFADLDADGRVDIIQLVGKGDTALWLSRGGWDLPTKIDWGALWDPDSDRLWADVNGDGHDDLVLIDAGGSVSFHPTFDARGRVQAAALSYSMLVSTQAAALRAEQTAEMADTVSPLDPPMSEALYEQARDEAEQRVADAIEELIDALPEEADLHDDEDVRWARELAMTAAIGKAVLSAGPVGVTARGEDCANAILHETAMDGAVQRRRPSYLFDVATALSTTSHPQRVARTVDALTAVSSGFRCTSNGELARVDEAFTNAVLAVAGNLYDDGRPLVAKWLVDGSLPIALLTFDAVKYNSLPHSYRLFRARFDGGVESGVLPEEGFDFDVAADDPDCETFVCQTYGNDRRADPDQRWLILDEIGIWLPDPLRSGRLAQLGVDPREMFEELADLRNLGAGDCSLFEVVNSGFSCGSQKTCDADSGSSSGADWDLLPDTSDHVLPGGVASGLTHLLTPRAGLSAHNDCDASDAGGGATGSPAATGCLGPALDPGGGRFSHEPELDNMMRCAIEMGAAPVDVNVDLGEFCIAGQTEGGTGDDSDGDEEEEGGEGGSGDGDDTAGGGDGGNAGGEGTGPAQPPPNVDLGDILRNPNSRITRRIIAAYRARYAAQTSGLTDAQISAAITGRVANIVDAAQDANLAGVLGLTQRLEDGTIEILFDLAAHADQFHLDDVYKQVAITLVHEAVHALSRVLSDEYGVEHSADRDHDITESLGWGRMCADGPCADSCGAGDTIFGRFAECVEPGAGASIEDVACNYAQDVCDDRRQGAMGYPMTSGCSPSLPENAINPECYVVQCGQDFGSLANACCSAESAPGGPVPVLDTFIGPGPMPPPPGIELSFAGLDGFAGLVGH